MKMKVCEVKSLAADCKCLEKAEIMLKRRDRLKCVSRSFRRQLIDHMANFDPSERSSRIMCEIMKQLDGIDTDIHNLCKSAKDNSEEESYTDLVKETLCSEKAKDECKKEIPAVCDEVMRPYDPSTDDDAKSIHLRYIPEIDSFKADMSQNPRAMRLPLMCPPMKRIMNKMKPSYLMDDVPCKLDVDEPPIENASAGRHLTVGFVLFGHSFDGPDDFKADLQFERLKFEGSAGLTRSIMSRNTNCMPKLWLVASQQLLESLYLNMM